MRDIFLWRFEIFDWLTTCWDINLVMHIRTYIHTYIRIHCMYGLPCHREATAISNYRVNSLFRLPNFPYLYSDHFHYSLELARLHAQTSLRSVCVYIWWWGWDQQYVILVRTHTLQYSVVAAARAMIVVSELSQSITVHLLFIITRAATITIGFESFRRPFSGTTTTPTTTCTVTDTRYPLKVQHPNLRVSILRKQSTD